MSSGFILHVGVLWDGAGSSLRLRRAVSFNYVMYTRSYICLNMPDNELTFT